MQGKRISLFTFFLSLLAVVLLAGRASAAEHKIIPGDNLNVTVVGEAEYSRQYKVSEDGKVMMPHIGSIVVHNKTVMEATKDIEKRLGIILKKPIVLVDVTSHVRFTGEVNNANPIIVQPEARLSHYLRQAGVKENTADMAKAYLVRREQKDNIPLDLKAVLNATDPSKDIMVEAGDTIYVPRKDAEDDVDVKVTISGAVSRPNEYTLTRKMSPMEAIVSLAGDFKSTADKTKVEITHKDSSRLTVDLEAAQRAGAAPEIRDLLLQDGDRVFVPSSEVGKVNVQGVGVKKSREVDFKVGMTVYDAIRMAADPSGTDNFTDDANKDEVKITRKGGAIDVVNIGKYERDGDMTQNVALEPGDLVFVGQATSESNQIEVSGLGVKNPGKYPFESGMRVMDAITRAGSFVERAKMNEVNVVRKDGQPVRVNMGRYFNNGDVAQNVELQKCDTVLVGLEKEKSNKRNVFEMLIPSLGTALQYGMLYR